MVTTWIPPNTTGAKNRGTQLWEHVFGTPMSSDAAFAAIEQGLSAGVLRKLEARARAGPQGLEPRHTATPGPPARAETTTGWRP